MAYCTVDDLIERYGETEIRQLTDRERLGVIDQAVVAGAIDRADRDIDGAIRDAGYEPPLTGWARLTIHSEQLARCYLYTGMRPEQVEQECSESRAFLARVSEGRISPPESVAGEGDLEGSPQASAADPVFSMDGLGDYGRRG